MAFYTLYKKILTGFIHVYNLPPAWMYKIMEILKKTLYKEILYLNLEQFQRVCTCSYSFKPLWFIMCIFFKNNLCKTTPDARCLYTLEKNQCIVDRKKA